MLNESVKRLYVSWRNPTTAEWRCIGRLERANVNGTSFCFEYLRGAKLAHEFRPLAGLPDLDGRYCSDELFAVFSTRLMQRNRLDYPIYMQWLGLPVTDKVDEFAELALSGGVRTADTIQLFPEPAQRDGRYETLFFVHGIRYQSPIAIAKSQELQAGELLGFVADTSSKFDGCAQGIYWNELQLGYVPRYLSCDIAKLNLAPDAVLSLEAVNADAPLSHRLLCRFSAPWPLGFEAFGQEEFQSLVPTPA